MACRAQNLHRSARKVHAQLLEPSATSSRPLHPHWQAAPLQDDDETVRVSDGEPPSAGAATAVDSASERYAPGPWRGTARRAWSGVIFPSRNPSWGGAASRAVRLRAHCARQLRSRSPSGMVRPIAEIAPSLTAAAPSPAAAPRPLPLAAAGGTQLPRLRTAQPA